MIHDTKDNDTKNKALRVVTPLLPIGSLDAYIQRAQDIPFLTPDEEYRLAVEYQEQGNLQAAQQLVLAHLRYVVRVSRGYLGYGLPLGDLIQEGTVGLMKAVKRFDPNVGVRLVSFAVHWIKAEIHEFILRNWRIVKVATTKAQRKLFFNLRSAKQRLGWSTKSEIDTIAADLGVSTEAVRQMEERLSAKDVHFDLSTDDSDDNDSGRSFAPVQYLEDGSADPAVQLASDNWSGHTEEHFKAAFQNLDARSQDILQKRWLSDKKSTLGTLGEIYNISQERVRQLEKKAMEKLRSLLQSSLEIAP